MFLPGAKFQGKPRRPPSGRSRLASVLFAAGTVLLVLYFISVVTILFTRWYLLPRAADYKDDIAASLGEMTRSEVSIGKIDPTWDGFWPKLRLEDVRFFRPGKDGGDGSRLSLPEVEASFKWRSVFGGIAFRSLAVRNASLAIERLDSGAFEVAGFEIRPEPPGGTDETDPLASVIGWLMKQDRLDILDSSLSYIDRTLADPKPVVFEDIDASFFRRGAMWHFGSQASLAGEGKQPTRIDARAEFHPSLFKASNDWKTWVGRAYLKTSKLDLAAILSGITSGSFVHSATGSTEAWLDFDSGRLSSLTANLLFEYVDLHLGKKLKPLHLTDVSTQVRQSHERNVLSISLKELEYTMPRLGRKGPIDFEASVNLAGGPPGGDENHIKVSRADLRDMGIILDSLPIPEQLARVIRTHRPGGTLSDVFFAWQGAVSNPSDWRFSCGFQSLYAKAVPDRKNPGSEPGIPGIANFSGRAEARPDGGVLELATTGGRITLPGVFPLPEVALSRAEGRIIWGAGGGRPLTLKVENLAVENSDVALVASGSWENTGGAGSINLRADVSRASAHRAWRYMPTVLDADVRGWLKGGLLGGTCSKGSAVLMGRLDDFPWTDGSGKFRTECTLKNGKLDFAPSTGGDPVQAWPEVSGISGRLVFEGASMHFEADSAKTLSAAIGRTTVDIPDMGTIDAVLNLSGSSSGPFSTYVDYLDKSPLGAVLGNIFRGAKASGSTTLTLRLSIPLLRPSRTKVNGTLKLNGGSLTLASPAVPLTGISGSVSFTEDGVGAGSISGTANGQPFTATSSRNESGETVISASGTAAPSDLLAFSGGELARELLQPLSGAAPFTASVSAGANRALSVKVSSSMTGIRSDYPEPLKKDPETPWPTLFTLQPVKAEEGGGQALSIISKGRFECLARLPDESPGRPATVSLAIGTRAVLPASGMTIDIDADTAVVDDWEPRIRKLVAAFSSGSEPGELVNRVGARVRTLHAGEMTFKSVDVSAELGENRIWNVLVSSDRINGYLKWNRSGYGDIRGSFRQLHLPGSKTREKTWEMLEGRPGMPSITLQVDDFAVGGMSFGAAALKARRTADAWEVTQFSVANPAASLSASAKWSGNNRTELHAVLAIADGGEMLGRLGYPGVLEKTSGKAKAELSWDGPPWSPEVSSISGTTEISWQKGSIVNADSGVAGTVLSLVSLDSLLRRIRLDFSDLAQKGFAFDTITGLTTIGRGMCLTDNTKISGSQASIALSGVLDLTSRQLDYKALVFPDINAAGASIALAFVNPAVGLGTFLAQLLLRDPLSKALAVTYSITGPLDNPQITAMERPRAQKPAGGRIAP